MSVLEEEKIGIITSRRQLIFCWSSTIFRSHFAFFVFSIWLSFNKSLSSSLVASMGGNSVSIGLQADSLLDLIFSLSTSTVISSNARCSSSHLNSRASIFASKLENEKKINYAFIKWDLRFFNTTDSFWNLSLTTKKQKNIAHASSE